MHVVVFIEGGVVQDVTFTDCPAELIVETRDYDVEGCDNPQDLEEDEDCRQFFKGEWTP
jgi:hypothetical protein